MAVPFCKENWIGSWYEPRLQISLQFLPKLPGGFAVEKIRADTFRDAYRAAADPARWSERDPAGSLAARVSPGAPGAPCLDLLRERLAE